MYEESLRMPFLIRYPKEIQAGGINDDIILNIDFAPLFLDYAGVKNTPAYMQGSFRHYQERLLRNGDSLCIIVIGCKEMAPC